MELQPSRIHPGTAAHSVHQFQKSTSPAFLASLNWIHYHQPHQPQTFLITHTWFPFPLINPACYICALCSPLSLSGIVPHCRVLFPYPLVVWVPLRCFSFCAVCFVHCVLRVSSRVVLHGLPSLFCLGTSQCFVYVFVLGVLKNAIMYPRVCLQILYTSVTSACTVHSSIKCKADSQDLTH